MKSIDPHQEKIYQNQLSINALPEDEYNALLQPDKVTKTQMFFHFLFFLLTIGPIRFILAILLLIIVLFGTISIRLFSYFLQLPFNTTNSLCLRFAKFGIRGFLFCIGIIYVKYNGEPNGQARFLISNYVSWIDCLVLLLTNEYGVVVRHNHFKNSFFRYLISFIEPVFYNDRDRNHSKHFLKALCKRADDFSKPPILIFPEGYRRKKSSRALFKFDTYPFITPYLIQPISIRYTMWLIPDGWNTYGFREENVFYYIFRLFSIPPSFVTISFLPPMSMQNDGKADIKTFAEAVQLSLANHIGIPAVKPDIKSK